MSRIAATSSADLGARRQQSAEVLPLEQWHTEAAGRSMPAKTGLMRVLVVDDNRDEADNVSTLVELRGHHARVAYECDTAVEAMSAYQPDVLLLNVTMPNLNAFRLVQQLRRQLRCEHTLLIAITGSAEETQLLRAEGAGFDHYLVRPIDASVLEQLLLVEIRRLVRSPNARHATAAELASNGHSRSSSLDRIPN